MSTGLPIPSLTPLSPAQLRERIASGAEFALLDPREEGAFSARHLFFACCLPLSRMELLLATRLPRLNVPITLVTEGAHDEALAARAAAVLAGAGYTDLRVLSGGTDAWAAAGGEVFSGVNVPSKAFGEFVEHWHDTPRLPAAELARRVAANEDLVILDSRPFDEFQSMSIPGGVDCPGAELVYRVRQAAPDPTTTVVVNCAGRTRSIIGAQSLINAGIPNPVFALKDGTMGWKLAGLSLQHGETAQVAAPDAAVLEAAMQQAAAVASQCGVTSTTPAEVAAWRAESARTTFLLDVRTAAEYEAGHWPGALHAPGGQLVQATDEYVMIRQARLVLCDSEDGVRATMTAHWLLQLGWPDVRVLTDQPEVAQIGSGVSLVTLPSGVDELAPQALATLLTGPAASTAQVLDFSTSRQYKRAHLPGAMWATRARLAECVTQARASRQGITAWVVMAGNQNMARLAAADLLALDPGGVVHLATAEQAAWAQAGLAPTDAEPQWLSKVDDLWPKPTEGTVDARAAMQQYLDWEVGLVGQVEREGLARFRRLM